MTSGDQIDPSATWSTPFDAPLVPTFPLAFRDVLILTVLYRTDPAAIRRIVPPPLEVVDDLVAVQVYRMNDTDWFGAYNESAVQVAVEHPPSGRRGAYSPYLLLDHDGGIAAGREVYGQPKKFGQPRIEVRKDLVVGTVSRNGIDVITATMPYKVRPSTLDAARRLFDFETNINLKVIPSAGPGDGIRELTARRLLDVRVHECWTGPATMELRPNAQVPVHLLAVREVVCGFLWRCDFTLDLADVLHDYRTAGREADPPDRRRPEPPVEPDPERDPEPDPGRVVERQDGRPAGRKAGHAAGREAGREVGGAVEREPATGGLGGGPGPERSVGSEARPVR